MKYSINRKVSASLCGSDARLSIVGILSLVEDSLTELTGKLKIDGLTAIHKYGAILVFFRNHIKIFRCADWNDDIVVESFVSSKSAIRFCIDVCIKSPNEEIIAYSRVELCGIDINTGRIRKIETVGIDDTIEVVAPLCDIRFDKKQDRTLQFIESVKVRSSNIDYVHHTNNIEYIKFLLNTFTVAELEEHPIKEMEINYANQTFEDDLVSIYAIKDADKAVFEIKKDEQIVLKCEMWFDEKAEIQIGITS